MPCNTPPIPNPIDNERINQIEEEEEFEELDESMYEFIDADEYALAEGGDIVVNQDDSVATYVGHRGAVFTCSFDSTEKYMVSGSQDDSAFVWDVRSKAVVFECRGHKESVTLAKFSHDSKYVATADMSGLIKVWAMDGGHLVWSFETYEFLWMTWLHGSNFLLGGSIDGNLWKWSIPDGDTFVFQNPGDGVADGAVTSNDEKLCSGHTDGSLRVWDLNSNSLLSSMAGRASFRHPVNCIQISPDNTLIIAGSEDGDIKLIKMSDCKVLFTIHVCENGTHSHDRFDDKSSVESVGFCQNPKFVAAATNCGTINVYDTASKAKRCSISTDTSVVKIICDDTSPILYAALTGGMLQAYDYRTGNLLKTWTGHKDGLLDVALSSDKSLLLTASDDSTVKLFEKGILQV